MVNNKYNINNVRFTDRKYRIFTSLAVVSSFIFGLVLAPIYITLVLIAAFNKISGTKFLEDLFEKASPMNVPFINNKNELELAHKFLEEQHISKESPTAFHPDTFHTLKHEDMTIEYLHLINNQDSPTIFFIKGSGGVNASSYGTLINDIKKLKYNFVVLQEVNKETRVSYDDLSNAHMKIFGAITKHTDPNKIIIMGHSAGAGIATHCARKILDDNPKQPVRLFLHNTYNDMIMLFYKAFFQPTSNLIEKVILSLFRYTPLGMIASSLAYSCTDLQTIDVQDNLSYIKDKYPDEDIRIMHFAHIEDDTFKIGNITNQPLEDNLYSEKDATPCRSAHMQVTLENETIKEAIQEITTDHNTKTLPIKKIISAQPSVLRDIEVTDTQSQQTPLAKG